MAYSFICETCKHRNSRCIPRHNGTCGAYEEDEIRITVGKYLAMLLTNGKYKEAAKFLNEKEDINLCDYFNNEEDICTYSDCSACWENLLKSEYKGEV